MPRAAGLADELQKKLNLQAELIKSSGGVFEVKLGDELIFSKKQTGRFPEPGEVARTLQEKLAPSA